MDKMRLYNLYEKLILTNDKMLISGKYSDDELEQIKKENEIYKAIQKDILNDLLNECEKIRKEYSELSK